MACDRGHAYVRQWDPATKSWYLACVHCPHRILEG